MSTNLFHVKEKERLPFAEYVAIALLDIGRQWDDGITKRPEELSEVLYGHYSVVVDPQEVSDGIDILAECGLAFVARDALAGTFVRISSDKYEAFFDSVSSEEGKYRKAVDDAGIDGFLIDRADQVPMPSWELLKKYKVIRKYSEFGSAFVEAAMKRLSESDFSDRLALGSDRLVSFSDNLPIVEEIRAGLNDLKNQIQTNNEVANALSNAREEASNEVNSLQIVMDGTQTRASFLLDLSRRVLGWIGRLVAKTSAEEIVKHLTKLFVTWLS